jgi:hypothetical protein
VCVTYNDAGSCFPACCEKDGQTGCSEGRLCLDNLFGTQTFRQNVCLPANPQGLDGDACIGIGDCNVHSTCLNDPLTYPNGFCRTNECRSDSDCTEGAACVPTRNGTACFATCASDTECRSGEGYFCDERQATPICRHGEVGDACTEARHCGDSAWTCLTGVGFPGGYCSVTTCDPASPFNGCPDPSYCYQPMTGTPYCARSCNPTNDPSDCAAGYTCTLINPLEPLPDNQVYGCVGG